MPTLAQLNQLPQAAFTAALGHLFEHSPWVAEETWPKRPFASSEALHAALCATMRGAAKDRQLALIRAHPDLAGRLARQKQLTAESTREQASAGLDQLTDAELAEFTRNNAAYAAKFGFPFIICAREQTKESILAAFRERLGNDAEAERSTALAEVVKIVRLRLAGL